MQPSHSRKLSVLLLGLSLVGLPVSAPIGVMAQDVVRSAPVTAGELSEEERDALVTEEAVTWSEYWDDEAILESEDPEAEPPEEAPVELDPETASLPGDQEASAVTPQALSLPSAEGSIEGMGESFSPILSSGTATYSVPIAIPAGRAGVQPTFAISYSSTGGNSTVGFGWGFEAPYIARQTDRGLPRYHDSPGWTGEEDRFFYNGGQELVPVSDTSVAALDTTGVPGDYLGWQQYRARIEGAFMRFFRSPDLRRWAVQSPDGSLMEFGELPASGLPSDFGPRAAALQTEDGEGRGRIFRWFLTRMSDAHGSTVYYRYSEAAGDGSRYLSDVHYASPVACAGSNVSDRRNCTQPLANYGRRVGFVYGARPDVFSSYTAGWRVDLSQRLSRILVTSAEGTPGSRFMVRRYHFSYYPVDRSFHSLLYRVQVEGRPDAFIPATASRVAEPTALAEGSLSGSAIIGPTLPPLTFEYSEGRVTSTAASGFGGIFGDATTAPSSPAHSVDEGVADLFDVNSDGLPDLLVTDPARYRTPGGGPAAGVFFNGFTGASATPATPGSFSGAVNVVVPSTRATTMDLSNLNVVPMDIDGDGRSDLLHMPRFANYGYFMPTRDADDTSSTAGAAASPANQGWRFSYIPVALPTGVTDPRIDLGRDGAHIRAFDVNNDHLVDVVRTSGTVMQTWLNLGWLPGGEGRFGSATFVGGGSGGTGTWTLSTAPLESCVLYAGVPTDFEDPEVRLGDMNGDGIQDIVRIRRGRILYWPGRGLSPDGGASWGEGEQRCDRGEGADRYIEMETPPMELNTELDGVYIEDVNEDGAADVVQVRFDAIDVWFNRAGRSFTARVIADGTPARPAFLAGRIRFADMDGSGTVDVLYGNANDYRWVDLMGGVRPRLLTRVDNGLGALTSLEYGSSAEEYLRDLREASTSCRRPGDCRDRFTWSHVEDVCDTRVQRLTRECVHRSGGAPLVVQVVTAVETTDRLSVLGRENTVSRTEYAFHDGYYEGFEQEFRGFGAADATSIATGPSDTHPNGTTRSYFLQGRRPNSISTDRLADNPYESLKARVYLTESWDPEDGVTMSTGHSSYTVRRMLTGLDGRGIWFAYASRTDELRYDTSRPTAGAGTTYSFPSVSFETAAPGAPLFDRADDPQVVTARWDGPIHLRSDVLEMDNQGHAIRSAARGRDGTDEVITSVAKAVPLGSGGNWMWRPGSSWTEGSSSGATIFGHTTRGYNAVGDLILTTTYANLPITHATGFDFGSLAQINQTIMASSTFDVWGNATASCGGADLATTSASACLRYGTVSYDLDYSQFPLTEAIFTGPSSSLTTTGTWDRGLGVLRTVTDPNGFMTNVGYDGFGRVTFVRPPASDGCTSTMPVQHFTYSLTTDPAASPISTVIAYQENGCTPLVTSVIETRTYVDGLGRARATLSTAEGTGQWIQSGIALMNGRGTVRRTFQPERFSFGTNPTPTQALIVPSTPNELSGYDAFDRPTLRTPPTGGNYFTTYHALTRDECDPLDNGGVLPFMNTCTTIRLDGHGRVIDQILRNRQPGGPMEYYRLFTTYRADGAVTAIERAETTNDQLYGIAPFAYVGDRHITRTFTYDTAGRRIGTTDPDSDSYDVARTDRNRTWRYLFNPVGDLVAVRDPRGCGQDFFYDRAARLIAEDYIGCGESSFMNETTDLDLPLGSIGLTAPLNDLREVDVLYEFDTLPTWATTIGPGGSYLGRLGGVSDRGERSVMAYDARGQVVWTARQMAVIRAAPTLTIGTGADGRPTVSAAPTPSNRVYDTVASHTYMRTAHYDHGGRPTEMTLPIDPDYGGTAPRIGGSLTYNRRGLPRQIHLLRDDTPTTPMTDATPQLVVGKMVYTRDGLLESLVYGDDIGETREYTATTMAYDDGRRPVSMVTLRQPTASPDPSRPLGAVTVPFAQTLTWDIGNNLVAIADDRPGVEWPDGYRPQNVAVTHDALYRVVSADYEYATDDKYFQPTDTAVDWRTEANITRTDDPMRSRPAPMMDGLPASRPINMTWEYDWLGNAEEWTDDAHQFYERSIGDIVNGADVTGMERPGALRISTDLEGPDTDRGGWLEVDYGEDGNAVGMTVHAACTDAPSNYCKDTGGTDLAARRADIRSRCTCAQEQHYVYRWDEVNRIAEAMRFDRSGGSGGWTLMVRQRYLYDSANERTVKQTLDTNVLGRPEAVALYVYPGDFERRGLYRSVSGTTYDVHTDAETQYVVGGARLVWTAAAGSGPGVDREHRLTIGLSDLIQSTNVTLDLLTGELVETGNYYANGARESYRSGTSGERSAPEPMGFTGKEADEEVGLTYFGQRYLMAHLGRWASPDPLQTHAVGGGEALNGYHYVAGSVLQARDPQGLDGDIYEPPPVLAPEATAARDWAEVQSRFEGLSTRLGGDVHAVAELFRSSGWGRDRIMEGLSGAPHDPFLGRTTPTFRGMDNGAGIRPELQDGTTDQMRHIFSAMSIGYWFGRDGSRGLTGIAGVVGHELAGATNRIGQGAAGLAYADTFRTAVGYVIDASIRSEDLDYTRLDSLLAPIIAAGDLPAVNAGDGRSVADLRATVVGYAFGARLRESGVTTNGFASGGDAAAFIDRYVAGEPSTAAPGEPGPATPDGATPPDADR